jgi:hypothetical protein
VRQQRSRGEHRRTDLQDQAADVHRRSTRTLLVLAATATALLLGELLVAWSGIVPAEANVPARFRVPDPIRGWVLQPGASYVNPLPEQRVRVIFNAAGMRDVEWAERKPDGVLRIAVLGDSFMEGYSVNLEDSFHRRLEAVLRGAGYRVEVLNFGVGGYGTLQEYLVFRDSASRYSPGVVLLGFCLANDVRNNSRTLEEKLSLDLGQSFRPFLLDGSGEWRVSPVDVDEAWRRHEERTGSTPSLADRLFAASHLLRLARAVAHRIARSGDDHLAIYGVSYCEEPEEYRRAWETTRRILARLRDEVSAAGARLVVFSEPTYRETDPGFAAAVRSVAGNDSCNVETVATVRLQALLNDLGIPFIDLLPEFRDRFAGETLFRRSDRHWNPRGDELAASLVGSALQEGPLLEPAR